jgi:hypothetical protein
MQREVVFETWAPPDCVWSLWARPVLFAQMPDTGSVPTGEESWRRLELRWTPGASEPVVLLVDVDGAESVQMGLALAARGYRPVPLYNACTGPHEVVDQGRIVQALRAGTDYLAAQSLPKHAPPAFLLDARRMGPLRPLHVGDFDNRWQVFPQDFPSGAFLSGRGFKRAVLIQRGRKEPHEDVADVLLRWQDAGIGIEVKDVADTAPPVVMRVARLAWYRLAWRRVLEMLGMRRSPRTGFGRIVPEPSHG